MPLARRSATTTSMPRFSMVRRPRVDTRRLTKRLSVSSQNRCVCKFGRKRRRLRLFAWDTVLPVLGPLPVTWQTRDMITHLDAGKKNQPRFIPGAAGRGNHPAPAYYNHLTFVGFRPADPQGPWLG